MAMVSMFAMPNMAGAKCLDYMETANSPEVANVQKIPVKSEVVCPTPERSVVVVETLVIVRFSDGSTYVYYERAVYIVE